MFKVRVVSYSKPAIGVDLKDDLLQMVAYCARVSNPGNQNNSALTLVPVPMLFSFLASSAYLFALAISISSWLHVS